MCHDAQFGLKAEDHNQQVSLLSGWVHVTWLCHKVLKLEIVYHIDKVNTMHVVSCYTENSAGLFLGSLENVVERTTILSIPQLTWRMWPTVLSEVLLNTVDKSVQPQQGCMCQSPVGQR